MVMLKQSKEQQYVLAVIRGKAVATVDTIERINAKPISYWQSNESLPEAAMLYNSTIKHIKKRLSYSVEQPKPPFGFPCPVPFEPSLCVIAKCHLAGAFHLPLLESGFRPYAGMSPLPRADELVLRVQPLPGVHLVVERMRCLYTLLLIERVEIRGVVRPPLAAVYSIFDLCLPQPAETAGTFRLGHDNSLTGTRCTTLPARFG